MFDLNTQVSNARELDEYVRDGFVALRTSRTFSNDGTFVHVEFITNRKTSPLVLPAQRFLEIIFQPFAESLSDENGKLIVFDGYVLPKNIDAISSH